MVLTFVALLFNTPVFAQCTEQDVARARHAVEGAQRLIDGGQARPGYANGAQSALYQVQFCAGQVSLQDYCRRQMTGNRNGESSFTNAASFNHLNRLCRGQVSDDRLFRCSQNDVDQIQGQLDRTRDRTVASAFTPNEATRIHLETRLCAIQITEEQFCRERFSQLRTIWQAETNASRASRSSYLSQMRRLQEIARTHLRCAPYIRATDNYHKICSTAQVNGIRAYRDEVSTNTTGHFTNTDISRSHALLAHARLCAGSVSAQEYCQSQIPRTELPAEYLQEHGPSDDTQAFDFAMANDFCKNLNPKPASQPEPSEEDPPHDEGDPSAIIF